MGKNTGKVMGQYNYFIFVISLSCSI